MLDLDGLKDDSWQRLMAPLREVTVSDEQFETMRVGLMARISLLRSMEGDT